MRPAKKKENQALDGAVVSTFFRYLIPSLVGLIAMTSAALVDGIFIGNYVGVTALAAVNLILPIMTLLFGVAIMVAIGGSVRGGKYLGEGNKAAASAIFSKTLAFVAVYGAGVIGLGLVFETQLFLGLGATEDLLPAMAEYYRIMMPLLFPQLITIAMYFFIRLDGLPNFAAAALVIGSAVNVALDYLFIAEYGWGLTGAAVATGLSNSLTMFVLMAYFLKPERGLRFSIRQDNWREVFKAAYNGVSEFINEVSGGIVVFIFNWLLIERAGVNGVAAITVVNYLIFLSFMLFFAISDSIQVLVSQNFGACRVYRIRAFLGTAGGMIAILSLIFVGALLTISEWLVYLFVEDQNSTDMVVLATDFIAYMWPLFLFAGFNMLISGYLTAIHHPFKSGLVAACRSLILPTAFLILLYMLWPDYRFVAALSIAEGITFILAVSLIFRYSPGKIVTGPSPAT